MARTAITPKAPLGNNSDVYTAGAAVLTMTAADVANMNAVTASGNDLIVARNSGVSAHTVTITSVKDTLGRTGDITTYNLPAGETHIFGPFKNNGWLQTDGLLYFQANHAEVLFAVIRL